MVDDGLSMPGAVAVDRSEDVFIADPGNSRLVEDKPNGGGGYTQVVVNTGLTLRSPYRVALDRSGDVFIPDAGNNRVVEAKADGSGGYTPVVVDDSSVGFPQGVAVDQQGYVFVGDAGNDQVLAEKPTGSGYAPTVVETSNEPGGLAADPSGNLFIAESSCACGRVVEHLNSFASVSVSAKPDLSGKYIGRERDHDLQWLALLE